MSDATRSRQDVVWDGGLGAIGVLGWSMLAVLVRAPTPVTVLFLVLALGSLVKALRALFLLVRR